LGVCASRNRKRESRLSSLLVEEVVVVVVVDGFEDTSGVLSDGRGDDASSSCWCSFVIVIVNGTADDQMSQAKQRMSE